MKFLQLIKAPDRGATNKNIRECGVVSQACQQLFDDISIVWEWMVIKGNVKVRACKSTSDINFDDFGRGFKVICVEQGLRALRVPAKYLNGCTRGYR